MLNRKNRGKKICCCQMLNLKSLQICFDGDNLLFQIFNRMGHLRKNTFKSCSIKRILLYQFWYKLCNHIFIYKGKVSPKNPLHVGFFSTASKWKIKQCYHSEKKNFFHLSFPTRQNVNKISKNWAVVAGFIGALSALILILFLWFESS